MAFIKKSIVRIELSTPGEWIDVWDVLSVSAKKQAQTKMFRFRGESGFRPVAEVDLDAMAFAMLEVGIVAWSFPEPVTAAQIRELEEVDYDILSKRCDELWKGAERTDDARKN